MEPTRSLAVEPLALHATARAFADRLLARRPEWAPFVTVYERVAPGDLTVPGSLWLDVPSADDPAVTLWASVEEQEALVGLGERAAEALFDWGPDEQDAVLAAIVDFLDAIARAEVVVAWRRHRFLWSRWETCDFRPAAEAAADPRVVRVTAWRTGGERR